jgi:hypothetical protein
MKSVLSFCAIALFGAAFLAPSTFAADSCGGGCPKLPTNARAVSANGWEGHAIMAYPGNVLSATLKKGLKKRILIADGVLTAPMGMGMGKYFALGISVNGARMQPDNGAGIPGAMPGVVQFCDSDEGMLNGGMCAVVGHWWLDLDDPANTALLGVPLTVTLVGGDYAGAGGGPVDMSLRVRLEKK